MCFKTAIRHFVFLTLIFAASSSYAQVEAVITGPTRIEFGSLLILSGAESTGDNHDWIIDPKFGTPVRIDKNSKELWSGLPGPGIFDFILVVSNTKAEIAHTRWTVEVVLPSWLSPPPVNPPPVNPPPVNPPPVNPPPTTGKVKAEVERLTKQLNDKATTERLVSQLEAVAKESGSDLQDRMKKAIEDVLAKRTGTSASKDWLNGWRVPIDKLVAGEVANNVTLKSCLDEIIAGLRSSIPTLTAAPVATTPTPEPPILVKFGRTTNCPPCERFQNETRPVLENDKNIKLAEIKVTGVSYPYFEITANNKTIIHQGFLSADAFYSLIRSIQ